MLRFITAAAIAATLATASAGCIIVTDDDGDSTLTILNDSDFVLVDVYLAHVSDRTWGPDLLAGDLYPGEELVIYDIECGTYDVRVVDEFGLACDLLDIRLCFDDDYWIIDNYTLRTCNF